MKFQIKRLISQFFFLIYANLGAFKFKDGLCFPFFYCNACPTAHSACPLRPLELSVFNAYKKPGNFNIKLLLYPLVFLGVIGIITGRAICGWACPIGLLQRATGRIPRFLKRKFPIFKKFGQLKIEKYLRFTKYFILIGFVFITSVFIAFVFTDICPIGILVGTIPILALNPGQYEPTNAIMIGGISIFYIAFGIFILFLILIFLIERGWCRYFCPVGAILAPFNKVSFLHVEVDKDKCIHCNVCSDVCPMGIDVPNMHRDPECILCGKCVTVCPKSIVKFKKV